MKYKIIEHSLSILFVVIIFGFLLVTIRGGEQSQQIAHTRLIEPYLKLNFIDFGSPLHAALFKETLDIFYPRQPGRNDSLVQAIQAFRQEQFTNPAYKTGDEKRGLTPLRLSKLGRMYLQFIAVYVVVMFLTYNGAQSLAIYRFVKMKQFKTSYLVEVIENLKTLRMGGSGALIRIPVLLVKAVVKGASYAVLFAPAYVIAYSFKTRIDTDTYFFMVVLGVVSNGLLINYANKFYTFLLSESHKGYVQTATVKNLSTSYSWGGKDGITYLAVLRPGRMFPTHVFRHIYVNGRYQYLPTLKEHASFLITGLIIIEMALNIQGHLGYELLQNILYKQYDVVIAIIVGIYLVVKATEIVVDVWQYRESQKYENRT